MNRRLLAAAALTAAPAVLLTAAPPAVAQDAGDIADALCEVQVGYEDDALETGFLTDADLADLEDVVDTLQSTDAWFRVVVLGSPVEDADTTQAFADDLLDGLDGAGRVVVFDPDDVGVASSLDSAEEVRAAADAAFEVAGDEQSLALGVSAAAEALDVIAGQGGTAAQPARCASGAAGGGGDGGERGGGSSFWPWLIVLALVGGGVALVVVLARRSRRRSEAVPLGAAEEKVRAAVDEASTLIVDLAHQVDLPATPEPARTAFTEGGAAFAELGDELEDADTREELEAVWPRLQSALSTLRTAKALADGVPPPPPAPVEPLFPPEVLPPAAPTGEAGTTARPAPAPQYRRRSSNPFLTGAAMTALSVLLQRGMGSGRSHRPSWDGDIFGGLGGGRRGGGLFGGSSRSSGSRTSGSGRRSGGISYGSRRSGGGGVRRSGSLGRRR